MHYRSFRYRVYPTRSQSERLLAWESAMRFLWNLAHEQRLLGLDRPRSERVYPSSFGQMRELTALRSELPWLADVPRNICESTLSDLDKAWQRCFKRLARLPRWRRRGGQPAGLTEPHSDMWRIDGTHIVFPKLGRLRAVIHRPAAGKLRACTLRREGDQWFASVLCEIEPPQETRVRGAAVAIDVGITHLLADSNGFMVKNPRHTERSAARLARAQRSAARKKKGSKNRAKASLRVMRLHRKVRRQREHLLHVLSHDYAKSHGVVVIERLNVAGMVRARSFARGIADAGWSRFAEMLRYKLAWSGGTLLEVPAQFSSQTCSTCGAVDAASRNAGRFCCTGCGHTDHADLNAAKVLLTRANRSGLPVEGTAPEAAQRSRKVTLRTPRSLSQSRDESHG